MPDGPEAFTVATDDVLAGLVKEASERLVVVAPAVSLPVAKAISERIQALPKEAVTLVFDSDPEVYRLGYGTLEALCVVEQTAGARGLIIRRQPGVRIGVIIANDQTLIFTPTSALVEAGPNTQGSANAIRLSVPPRTIETDLGMTDKAPPSVGRSLLTPADVEAVKRDLHDNPPQKFDLARRVRVFNAFIEFVELEVRGTEVSRRTVPIPSYLLAVADTKTQEKLRATFRLVAPGDKLSGAEINKDRSLFTGKLLRVIPRYGTVVLRRDKEALQIALKKLEAAVDKFAERVKASIQDRIDKNVAELVKSLLPGLTKRPPQEWIPSSGERPNKDAIRRLLEDDLRSAFGTADQLIREMRVRCMFKGVTYELLNDHDFIKAVAHSIPELERFHREFDAAEQARDPSHVRIPAQH